jgi:hypothetical protein
VTLYGFEVIDEWGAPHRIAAVGTDREAAEQFRAAPQAARHQEVRHVPVEVLTFPTQLGATR